MIDGSALRVSSWLHGDANGEDLAFLDLGYHLR
jgi:hypothetical protein